jgi:hypothetical protein
MDDTTAPNALPHEPQASPPNGAEPSEAPTAPANHPLLSPHHLTMLALYQHLCYQPQSSYAG